MWRNAFDSPETTKRVVVSIDFKIPSDKYFNRGEHRVWPKHTEIMLEKNCLTELNSRYEFVRKSCACM